MNKRIEELVAAEMAEYFDGTYASNDGAKDQLARFAELIVRECAQIASDYDGDRLSVHETILNHFGVNDD